METKFVLAIRWG